MNLLSTELVIDNFAGGGGASYGIEQALNRPVDIAVNHDREAIEVHKANHPGTRHLCEDVWAVDPVKVCAGRPVGLAWFSPDCKHFSKAKGGKPVNKKIRGLAWVVCRWARSVQPRIIMLENVEEFQTWGPLLADGMPDPVRRGSTFRRWWRQLERLGYRLEARQLRASHYGTPTIRRRLFIIGRRDGLPIVWPDATHGPDLVDRTLAPFRTAAECIDWDRPCPSIFERQRPLAEATLRRIARGLKRFVFEASEPFIVTCNHAGESFRGQSVREPMTTLTAARDAHGVVVPYVAGVGGRQGQSPERSVAEPVQTITAKGDSAVVTPLIVPIDHQSAGDRGAQGADEPLTTITAQGTHLAEVRAFLIKYFGQGTGQPVTDPMHSVTTKDRFGLVTVQGQDYEVVDIGLRMLEPRELFRAQGFPDHYVIAPRHNGKPLGKSAQIRMCGNSVCPPVARALVEANIR